MAEKQVKSLAGTEDRLPWQWKLWNRLHKSAREQFDLYCYGAIDTPVIEDSSLFVKGTGQDTEIVEKQMYTISSAADEEESAKTVTLRPEGTPPAIRAYLEADLHKKQRFRKFWYAGPMFRREKPQKGRLRQFHQLGVEAIGGDSPMLDAETILLAADIYKSAGLRRFSISVNTIGCAECRPEYRSRLNKILQRRSEDLCPDCIRRLDRNVLRILDCKEESCRDVVSGVPEMGDALCAGCTDHHHKVKSILDAAGVSYYDSPRLVRGLDYYTRTVYEIKHDSLGARDTICGGGRYDGLVAQLGGPHVPCVGFAMGVEASLIALEQELSGDLDGNEGIDIYIVCFDDNARLRCFELASSFRSAGISAEMDYEGRSPKAQMRMADRAGASFCALIGEAELAQNSVTFKEMRSGEQWQEKWGNAASALLQKKL